MKKRFLPVALCLLLAGSITFTSCIGQFALTKNIMDWNKTVSNKFVNELIFIGFWILPVYEVTFLADLFVINSIEFWSGDNPVACGTRAIDTDHGRYLVTCDGKGYDITDPQGNVTRMDFDTETQTWSVEVEGESYPLLTFVDPDHVKMITPEGDMRMVELSHQGVLAYEMMAGAHNLASND